MDVIEYFFETLEKEGLYKGRIDFGNKEYTFSVTKGISKIEVKEKEAVADDKQMTIERVQVAESDNRSFYVSRSDTKIRKSSSFKFIFFILIFVAITILLIVGIPLLNKKPDTGNRDESSWLLAKKVNTVEAYRGYLADFPSGRYSLESRNRLEQFLFQDRGEENFQKYYTQASNFFEQGKLSKAISELEKAKKIKTSEKTVELEQKIKEKIEALKRDEEFNNYINNIEDALQKDDFEKAKENLILAKKLKSNEQTDLLENRIELQQSEIEKREDEAKRNDVYSRYFNFARSYYDEGNYSKALVQIRKAKKIKTTPELTKFENQIKLKLNSSKKKYLDKKREENFQRYFNAARGDFDKGKYEQALDNIKKARAIKTSTDLDSLEKEILRVKMELEKEKTTVEQEKKKKQIEHEYKKYKSRAEVYYEKAEYNKALYNVNRAKSFKNTLEIKSLEKKIKTQQSKSIRVKSVKLMSLPPSMINRYNTAIKKIDVLNIPRGIKALGQINMSISIAQNGNITIQSFNESRFQVMPPRSKRLITSRIIRTINSINLSPPINRNGEPVSVENWRVSYNVGTFKGKIILRRKF